MDNEVGDMPAVSLANKVECASLSVKRSSAMGRHS